MTSHRATNFLKRKFLKTVDPFLYLKEKTCRVDSSQESFHQSGSKNGQEAFVIVAQEPQKTRDVTATHCFSVYTRQAQPNKLSKWVQSSNNTKLFVYLQLRSYCNFMFYVVFTPVLECLNSIKFGPIWEFRQSKRASLNFFCSE